MNFNEAFILDLEFSKFIQLNLNTKQQMQEFGARSCSANARIRGKLHESILTRDMRREREAKERGRRIFAV